MCAAMSASLPTTARRAGSRRRPALRRRAPTTTWPTSSTPALRNCCGSAASCPPSARCSSWPAIPAPWSTVATTAGSRQACRPARASVFSPCSWCPRARPGPAGTRPRPTRRAPAHSACASTFPTSSGWPRDAWVTEITRQMRRALAAGKGREAGRLGRKAAQSGTGCSGSARRGPSFAGTPNRSRQPAWMTNPAWLATGFQEPACCHSGTAARPRLEATIARTRPPTALLRERDRLCRASMRPRRSLKSSLTLPPLFACPSMLVAAPIREG